MTDAAALKQYQKEDLQIPRVVADRSALNHVSVKGIKTVREAVHNYGGAQNVPNTAAVLNSVKHSHHEKRCMNIGIDKFNKDLEYLQKSL